MAIVVSAARDHADEILGSARCGVAIHASPLPMMEGDRASHAARIVARCAVVASANAASNASAAASARVTGSAAAEVATVRVHGHPPSRSRSKAR